MQEVLKPMTFEEAERNCEILGSHLASFSSVQQFKNIRNRFPRTNWWIGLKQVNQEWAWTDAKNVDYGIWSKYGLSKIIIDVQKCMRATERGSWERSSCELDSSSLCKLDPLESCRPGFNEFQGFCYNIETKRVAYEVAQNFCLANGADIVWVTSSKEQGFLNGLASSHPFWLSLVLESGSWVWKAEESPSFLNWKHGEPNHCCPEEEASNAFSEPSGWSDTSYLSKYAVVCKYKKGILLNSEVDFESDSSLSRRSPEDQSRLIAILPLSPFYATGIVLLVMVAITITAILCRKKPVVIVEYAKVPEIFEDDSYSAKVYYHNPTIIREYDA
ncbi:unnamed protein product [Enterobius vermicularis]|uniref:C-type lectin domain-containing protein n=1 Tax=Enterobius vermicularis TaxID=51028 RepID=A0A0N4UWZ7_ENTVE|nr:unnamed protein product [Enterobius vermicularis]